MVSVSVWPVFFGHYLGINTVDLSLNNSHFNFGTKLYFLMKKNFTQNHGQRRPGSISETLICGIFFTLKLNHCIIKEIIIRGNRNDRYRNRLNNSGLFTLPDPDTDSDPIPVVGKLRLESESDSVQREEFYTV